jgi:hypothetical protein
MSVCVLSSILISPNVLQQNAAALFFWKNYICLIIVSSFVISMDNVMTKLFKKKELAVGSAFFILVPHVDTKSLWNFLKDLVQSEC